MSIPNFLSFLPIAVNLEAAGEKKIPTFSMVAYTGGTMRVDGFAHPVVVDMSGLDIPSHNLPIRLDHKPSQGVGHSTRIAAHNGELVAEGLISRDTSFAKDVASSGTNGFPWKASIGGPVIQADFVASGNTVEVNGRKFEGPVYVVRNMTLKEISFVDNAADSNTHAVVQAKGEPHEMPLTFTPQSVTPTNMTPPTSNPASGDTQTSVDQIQKQIRAAAVAETHRIEAIRKIASGRFPDLESKAIEEGWDATRFELAFLRASRPSETQQHSEPQRPAQLVLEAIAMQSAGTSLRALEKQYSEPILEAADRYRGIGLQEFCEMACGRDLPRFRRDASGWLQAAFSTVSLPGILSNIANKMLLDGYEYVEDAWRQICKFSSVNNFQEHVRYRLTSSFKFEKIGDGGELKHGKIDEQKFSQKADTFGIMFALTRQMIINDDLAALTDIPRQIGMGAAEAICDAVWELLLSNPVQPDGKPFFHKEHKNLIEGPETALDVDGLTLAEIAFMEQVKPNGRPLGIPARIMLVPTALKVVAEMLMKSTVLNETTPESKGKPNTNPHAGKFEVTSTSYLSNATFKNASSKAWYLLADPNRLPALEVAFLGGQDRPTVERADADFNVLGIQFRGYLDFGVKEQDHRGILKMKGEA